MTCPACTRSLTNRHCSDVNPDCPDCVLRELARSTREKREAAYDAIERLAGQHARREIMRRVMVEHARIFQLKGRTA